MHTHDTSFELAAIPEHQRALALKQFHTIRPFIEDGLGLRLISRTSKTPLRTLRRWVTQYRKEGFAGLVRRPRLTVSSMPDEMRQLIEGLALQSSGRTVSSIKRELDTIATERNWPALSYHTLLRAVRKLDKGLVSLAHEGAKVYSEKFDLIHRREATRPNEIWQSDHTLLDCWLKDENGQPARPWLSIILDDYSRSICAYSLSFAAPAALRTALMLRQAIWRKPDSRWHMLGIPDRFYTDHGSDYTSMHMEQVAADIKMGLIFSRKGKPRGRGKVERFFGTVNELFLCHVPGNLITGAKPEDAKLTLNQLNDLIYEWIVGTYQLRTHSELQMPPQSMWEQSGFLPRMPESLEQLDLLLLTVATPRCVQPDGIHFQNLRYVSPVLAPYVREKVIIRFDPQDLAEIRVYHNNRFLCRAICGQLESQKVSLKDIEEARKLRRRHLGKQLSTRQKIVETYLQSHVEQAPEITPKPSQDNQPKLKKYQND